ncbi:MAG TPA: BamA/TamA family outer membrane protein, partial [Paracoccaceae bacterium]|nr:BamA/TamA family outer membrane protein [Paracoccaceae bacterium]
FYAGFDNTDDLLNPTKGLRARLDMTPYAGLHDAEFTDFFQVDSNASTYWDFLGNGKYVLAGRARLGSILASELADVPKNRRLYSGGGGSVRGYARREVGPLDRHGDPIGGRSVAEASVEMRAKLYGELGGVVFADAGTVDRKMFPDFDRVQYAAGAGVRYYSPIGPIRLDVAFPLNPRDSDDAFQLYFSIGQAF